MKRILLLSDTHSYLDDRIIHYAKQADEIWHAGDIGKISVTDTLAQLKPVKAVYGNIDGSEARKQFPKHLIFTEEGVKVFITHIGGYPKRYPKAIKEILLKERHKLFICGHSHILKAMYDKDLQLLHLNPGACGNIGFHKIRTMLRFEIDKAEIKNLEVIELGKR